MAEVNGTTGEHIRLAVDWLAMSDDSGGRDLLKSWNITEWYPKKMTQFPTWFFYLSTDLKEWKKLMIQRLKTGK